MLLCQELGYECYFILQVSIQMLTNSTSCMHIIEPKKNLIKIVLLDLQLTKARLNNCSVRYVTYILHGNKVHCGSFACTKEMRKLQGWTTNKMFHFMFWCNSFHIHLSSVFWQSCLLFPEFLPSPIHSNLLDDILKQFQTDNNSCMHAKRKTP